MHRFVRRDGWEKWIDVDAAQLIIKVPDAIEVPFHPLADVPERAEPLKVRLFERQEWRVERRLLEFVYVEDGLMLDDADRFGPDRPSLFRERELRRRHEDLLAQLRSVLDDAQGARSPLVAAFVGAEVARCVENIVSRAEARHGR